MEKITIRKSACNKLMHSKDYYEKQKDYYKQYQKNYYVNNKDKFIKPNNNNIDEKRRIYNRNYVRNKNNYKNVTVIDERFNTNLSIDSFDNFDEFKKELNI